MVVASPSPSLVAAAVLLVYRNALIWHPFLAAAFSRAKVQSAYNRRKRQFAKLSGVLLGGFGLKLLVETGREFP